jgi:hypothetical protein
MKILILANLVFGFNWISFSDPGFNSITCSTAANDFTTYDPTQISAGYSSGCNSCQLSQPISALTSACLCANGIRQSVCSNNTNSTALTCSPTQVKVFHLNQVLSFDGSFCLSCPNGIITGLTTGGFSTSICECPSGQNYRRTRSSY